MCSISISRTHFTENILNQDSLDNGQAHLFIWILMSSFCGKNFPSIKVYLFLQVIYDKLKYPS